MTELELQEWQSNRKKLSDAIVNLKLCFDKTLEDIQNVKNRYIAVNDFELAANARGIEKRILESKNVFENKR